nr:hypothetical protein [Bradyrhizobium guangxiense]
MTAVEATVRDRVNGDRDCIEQALAQMNLRRKINLVISEWKAAGGGDVLPDVGDRVRHRLVKTIGNSARASMRR